MNARIRQWVLLGLLASVACGGSSATTGEYSCDLRNPTMNLFTCRDFEELTDASLTQSFQANCVDPNQHGGVAGTWSTGACSRTGALGGCRTTSQGVVITIWSFPGNGATSASVMASCAAGGGTFVSP